MRKVMTVVFRTKMALMIIALSSLLLSCDSDPFGLDSKGIVGEYELEYFRDGDIFFVNRKGFDQQGGVFAGIIIEIGWSDKWIIALVRKQSRRDKDGYYAIDVESHGIMGPFSKEDAVAIAKGVKLKDVREAYRSL